jgi:type IV pilus assembly protein PilW
MRQTTSERGFTLIELMIAILIGLFLAAGLLTLVQAMKRTSITQAGLSQLQDNERMAMTIMADVIQSAGYYPQPQPPVNTPANMFPVFENFAAVGQTIYGTGAYGDNNNIIEVRYVTGGIAAPAFDNTINCTGSPAGGQTSFINQFQLQPDPNGFYDLVCVLNDSAQPVLLVSGVVSLNIYYGVQTNPGVSNNSADTYLDANTVTANNAWGNVISVKITLAFVNPMYGTGTGQTTVNQPQTIQFTRVIDVMNRAGVST